MAYLGKLCFASKSDFCESKFTESWDWEWESKGNIWESSMRTRVLSEKLRVEKENESSERKKMWLKLMRYMNERNENDA